MFFMMFAVYVFGAPAFDEVRPEFVDSAMRQVHDGLNQEFRAGFDAMTPQVNARGALGRQVDMLSAEFSLDSMKSLFD